MKNQFGFPKSPQKEPVSFAVGNIVFVKSRTWPGINKPGGVARIVKVLSEEEAEGNGRKYNVSYVIGGREKAVEERYVSIHRPEEEQEKEKEKGYDNSAPSR